jgi:hypothetical protein
MLRFARLGVSVEDFLARMSGLIHATSLEPSNRQVTVDALPVDIVNVTRADILWGIHRYLSGKVSGWEISNWAGLLLAVNSFSLPTEDKDDELLALLADLATPLAEDKLDRQRIRRRLGVICKEGGPK